jgi:hypothetical protein
MLARDAKVQTMMNKIEDMKSVLNRNIRLVLRNQEEQLDVMERRSELMKRDSVVFKKRTEVLLVSQKRKQRMKYCCFGSITLAVCYVLLAVRCGFNLAACRVQNSSGGE